MPKFDVTYEKWSYEDSEYGDTDNRGFIGQGLTLREALTSVVETDSRLCDLESIEASDSRKDMARWVTVYNSPAYDTGIAENRSLHIPESITGASRKRIINIIFNWY